MQLPEMGSENLNQYLGWWTEGSKSYETNIDLERL